MHAVANLPGLANKVDRARNVCTGRIQGSLDLGLRARCILKCRDYLKNARTRMVKGSGDGDIERLRTIVKGLKVSLNISRALGNI